MINKLVLFRLLDQLEGATTRSDLAAVNSLRGKLILCPTSGDERNDVAIDHVFYVSGKWARGMIHERVAKPLLCVEIERAIIALQPPRPD